MIGAPRLDAGQRKPRELRELGREETKYERVVDIHFVFVHPRNDHGGHANDLPAAPSIHFRPAGLPAVASGQMSTPPPGSDAWRALVEEDVVDPGQRIVDAHHHLWPSGGPLPYSLAELQADLGSGHRVEKSVFIECRAAYRTDGPAELAPVGETEFAAAAAEQSQGVIAGIVAHADLQAREPR